MQFLILGASSAIAQATQTALERAQHQCITISRATNGFKPDYVVKDYSPTNLPDLDVALDGFLYCPGSIQLKPFNRIQTTEFVEAFTINAFWAATSIQKYLPNLKKADQASIVLFSTVAVQVGMPYHASIAMAKGAVEGLTKSLAAELAPRIRVNAIAPSLTDTTMATALINTPEKRASIESRNPLKQIGTSEQLAAMATFLLTNNASWITGQVLHVDGGMSTLKV